MSVLYQCHFVYIQINGVVQNLFRLHVAYGSVQNDMLDSENVMFANVRLTLSVKAMSAIGSI